MKYPCQIKINSILESMDIDIDKITLPKISMSSDAISQILLIIENDFTASNKYLRVTIDGKGCDGFKYAVGMDFLNETDFQININYPKNIHTLINKETPVDSIKIIMDPFAAYYLQEFQIDYQFNPSTDEEGFIINNKNQNIYEGKFWRKDQTKVPPVKN